ncbi:hypothetical protein ABGN05_22250 [Aquibium sp. LZ166]|uniref:Secreted protein n=1 Tax=Aquibium pacificus TaxID=3153579 RepID=A0ABV3SNN0_9HYPH
MLEQIFALIVSFAGLADRAATLPLCLQLPGLAFLVQAEAVARCFVVGLPSGAPAALAISQSSDRATRLAADFRALALILRTMLARARRRARHSIREDRPSMRSLGSAGTKTRKVTAPAAPDTS